MKYQDLDDGSNITPCRLLVAFASLLLMPLAVAVVGFQIAHSYVTHKVMREPLAKDTARRAA